MGNESVPVGSDGGDKDAGSDDGVFDDRHQALLEHLSETLNLIDAGGELVARVGPRIGSLGFNHSEPDAPRNFAERLHPDDLLPVLELIERVRAEPGASGTARARARHKDGRWRILEVTVQEVSDDHRLAGAIIRTRDITGLIADRRDPGDTFRSLADAVPSGILTADAQGWVLFSNAAARQILDLPAESLIGRGWESVVLAEDLTDVMTAASAVLGASPGEQVTFRVQTRSGERWVHARFVPLRVDASDAPPDTDPAPGMGWIAALEDITDRRRMESQLAHRATHDPLTNLPNRALLEDRLEQACARLTRGGERVALLFCDLDGFKEINDQHGHTVGDEVLVEVARRLRRVLRPADTVARLGGDEFVVVCEATDAEAAAEVADRIADALDVPFLVAGTRARIGVSVGIASTSDPTMDPSELLLLADQAMYRQKHLPTGVEQPQGGAGTG
jgi:diguanylate cyclase (GGDEF)-like protein/PAS domain S-box-containing protein